MTARHRRTYLMRGPPEWAVIHDSNQRMSQLHVFDRVVMLSQGIIQSIQSHSRLSTAAYLREQSYCLLLLGRSRYIYFLDFCIFSRWCGLRPVFRCMSCAAGEDAWQRDENPACDKQRRAKRMKASRSVLSRKARHRRLTHHLMLSW